MSGDAQRRLILHMEMLGQIGLVVLGRRAYEEMAPAWSSSDSPMARILNALPKIVFVHGGSEVEWNAARATDGPVEQEIPRLKREPGHDIVAFGGGHFAHSLIRARRVDEYRLTVHPVALGDGISLMHGLPEPQRFELIGSTAYADGCIVQILGPS